MIFLPKLMEFFWLIQNNSILEDYEVQWNQKLGCGISGPVRFVYGYSKCHIRQSHLYCHHYCHLCLEPSFYC